MKRILPFLITSLMLQIAVAQTVQLNIKVYIEGPYNNGQMTPFLNDLGHLPESQPYNATPWNYLGTESVTSFPSPDIVDWVLVDILKPHADNNQIRFEVMGRKAGFLFNDGFIKDLDGIGNLTVATKMTSGFYIRIHHRNHLSIVSAVSLVESGGVFSYDFTLSVDQALGGSLSQKQLSAVIWSMIAADANASGQIDNHDKNDVWLPQKGLTGYYEGDFNMDTQVDSDDKVVKWEPNTGKRSYPVKDTILPFFICGSSTVIFNGLEYGTVKFNNKCWLDRNLGATQVATDYNDPLSYGDLFQWGRLIDGHQFRASATTNVLSSSDIPGHSEFIITEDNPYDWRNPQNDNLWQETSNINNPCPDGWKVPSITQWQEATSGWTNRTDAFNSQLKLPAAGWRSNSNGNILHPGSKGKYWSINVNGSEASGLYFDYSNVNSITDARAIGQSIRCLKSDYAPNNPPNEPSDPFPVNEATSVDINISLSWNGSDPDNDDLIYTIYFGISATPPLIEANFAGNSWNPGILNFNTNYYWKIVAYDIYGDSTSGVIWNFKTGGGLPIINTLNTTEINGTTAACGGIVILQNGAAVTARGVCWSTAQNPTISDAHTSDGAGAGSFISQITGLTTVTKYYVRAYATNSFGTAYGSEMLFNTTWEPCQTVPDVTYEGQTYNTVQIGNQCWLKENLNVGTQGTQTNNGVIEKACYNNDPGNCAIYGGLYTWYEMMQYNPQFGSQGICPTGWHIPTKEEFDILINHLGGYEIAGSKMKEAGTLHWSPPNNDATNESGFTALPKFTNGSESDFWTSSQSPLIQKDIYHSSSIDLNSYDGYVSPGYWPVFYAMSVRCVKNENHAPTQPNNPSPINNAQNQSRNSFFTWDCYDPEDDPILFDVFFDTTNPPILVSSGQSETIYNPTDLLLPGTTYYWKIIAYDTLNQFTSGPVWSFTTQNEGLPIVTTEVISNIGITTATGGGFIIEQGNSPVTSRGVCWNLFQNPTINDSVLFNGSGNENFISEISGLFPSSTYFIRAFATNNEGVGYGPQLVFTTLWESCPGIPAIIYDGQTYNTVKIGSQCWLKENLNVGTQGTQTNNGVIEKYCYDHNPVNCEVYGGLYRWNEIMQYTYEVGTQGICPVGWHIPSNSEFQTMIDFLGGEDIAGSKMKEAGTLHWSPPNNDATNESGFTGLPGGYLDLAGWDFFMDLHGSGLFGSASGDFYYGRLSNTNFSIMDYNPYIGASSVRCIKNINQPPAQPNSPLPEDGAQNQSLDAIISWTCSDPENDSLTYNVYFGSSNPPLIVTVGQSEVTYNPGLLEYNKTYYWKIVAYDDHFNSTEGPIWTFITIQLP